MRGNDGLAPDVGAQRDGVTVGAARFVRLFQTRAHLM
jgi:hypothetical protein